MSETRLIFIVFFCYVKSGFTIFLKQLHDINEVWKSADTKAFIKKN